MFSFLTVRFRSDGPSDPRDAASLLWHRGRGLRAQRHGIGLREDGSAASARTPEPAVTSARSLGRRIRHQCQCWVEAELHPRTQVAGPGRAGGGRRATRSECRDAALHLCSSASERPAAPSPAPPYRQAPLHGNSRYSRTGPLTRKAVSHARPQPGPARANVGGPVATEPEMHSRAILVQEGLDPRDSAVPDTRSNPNGTDNVFHADVPLGSTTMALNCIFGSAASVMGPRSSSSECIQSPVSCFCPWSARDRHFML